MRRWRPSGQRRSLAVCLAAAALLIPAVDEAGAVTGFTADWLSYGGNAQLTNYVPAPTGARAFPRGVAWTTTLDGPMYGSPVAIGGVATATGVHDLVIVGTEAGSVYAVDTHTGTVIWKRSFPRQVTQGCGNWGITSTGAIDKQLGVVYVATPDGFLHAFQLGSGAEANSNWPTPISMRTGAEYVWGGLRIVNSRVYVGLASYCGLPDPVQGLADGRLVSVSESDPSDHVIFDPVPGTNNEGGIWGYGGVSTDTAGDTLYLGVGNSMVTDPTCNCTIEDAGFGAELVALRPDLSQVVASSRPPYIPKVGDSDFGATPLVFQPKGCPPLLAMNNKNGNLFIWNRLQLANGPIARFGIADSQESFIAEPSWSPVTQMMYDSHAVIRKNGQEVGEGIAAIAVGKACTFEEAWLTQTGSGQELPPLLVGNTLYGGSGRSPGLAGLDARTGKIIWRWSSGTSAMTTPLIEADGMLISGDDAGALRAFSLL